MKIGTETNCLVNHLYSRMTKGAPTPVVGMGATILGWTDRHAATITSVNELKSKKWMYEIEVQRDSKKVISGSIHDGSADFFYTPNIEGSKDIYRMDRNTGKWINGYINPETKRFIKLGGSLIIGFRESYIDPSF